METTSATVEQPATEKTPEQLQRQRIWPAALALLFLAPIVGEMISGSTPPLLFVQPFAFSVVLPATGMPAIAAMALILLLFASALWRVRSWSTRAGWKDRHLLSIAIGVILYFTFFWGPFGDFVLQAPGRTGLTVVNILIVVALLIFDQRLKRRLARHGQAEATLLPTGFTAPLA